MFVFKKSIHPYGALEGLEPVNVVWASDQDASQKLLSVVVFWRGLQGRSITGWRDYTSHLDWDPLEQSWRTWLGEKDIWDTLLGWMDGWMVLPKPDHYGYFCFKLDDR